MFYDASLQYMCSKRDIFSSGSSSSNNSGGGDGDGGSSSRSNFMIVDGDHSSFVYVFFMPWR